MKYTIGVDLGGTKIAAGLVDNNGNIIKQHTLPTDLPRPSAEIEKTIAHLCDTIIENSNLTYNDIDYIGIGSPGTVNGKTGIVESASNFGYTNWHLAENIKMLTGCETIIENDANCAAFGEYLFGAAKDYSSCIMITIGTGIGGGFIFDNKIYTGFSCKGAEPGHMVIEKNGRACSCGRKGCFEQYASSGALISRAIKKLKYYPESNLNAYYNENKSFNAKIIFSEYTNHDVFATILMNEFFAYLACGISNLINLFEPNVICIGGGISREGDGIVLPLKELLKTDEYRPLNGTETKIVTAKLFNDAGIIGASMLKKQL